MFISKIVTIKRMKRAGRLQLSSSHAVHLQAKIAKKEVKPLLILHYNSQQEGLKAKWEDHLVILELINLKNMLLSKYLWFWVFHYLHTSHICRFGIFRLRKIQKHTRKRQRWSILSLLRGGKSCSLTGSLKATQKKEHHPIHRRAQLKNHIERID